MCFIWKVASTLTFSELITKAKTEVLHVGGQPGDVVDVLLLLLPGARHPALDLLHGQSQIVGGLANIPDLTKNHID